MLGLALGRDAAAVSGRDAPRQSQPQADAAGGARPAAIGPVKRLENALELALLDADAVVSNHEHQRAILSEIEGVVLLDGTWSQAKALWWRNAWMLKCQRVILGPKQPSRYGQLRKEPRRDGLSTIEAAALTLSALERRPEIAETLIASFERMLARFRQVQATTPELAPKPKKRDFRRRRRG